MEWWNTLNVTCASVRSGLQGKSANPHIHNSYSILDICNIAFGWNLSYLNYYILVRGVCLVFCRNTVLLVSFQKGAVRRNFRLSDDTCTNVSYRLCAGSCLCCISLAMRSCKLTIEYCCNLIPLTLALRIWLLIHGTCVIRGVCYSLFVSSSKGCEKLTWRLGGNTYYSYERHAWGWF